MLVQAGFRAFNEYYSLQIVCKVNNNKISVYTDYFYVLLAFTRDCVWVKYEFITTPQEQYDVCYDVIIIFCIVY